MQTPTQQRPFETVMAVIRATTILLGVYWLAIFAATHLPGQSLPSVGSDKLYHVVAFGGLGLLLSAVMSLRFRHARSHAMVVLSIALLYAVLDEWSQQFVAGRNPDVKDFIADSCGTLLGLVSFWIARLLVSSEARLAKQAS
jgi:VanZ family protein